MPLDPNLLRQSIEDIIGNKPHPDVPEVKVKDYNAFARAAARMFDKSRPAPKDVASAYHALTNADISPAEFERIWDVAKPLSNRLLDRDPTIHDLAMLVHHKPNEIQSYYMDHPHPEFPTASAGEIDRYATSARWPANKLAGRDPYLAELHQFVVGGYSMDDIVKHYSDDGSSKQPKVASGEMSQ